MLETTINKIIILRARLEEKKEKRIVEYPFALYRYNFTNGIYVVNSVSIDGLNFETGEKEREELLFNYHTDKNSFPEHKTYVKTAYLLERGLNQIGEELYPLLNKNPDIIVYSGQQVYAEINPKEKVDVSNLSEGESIVRAVLMHYKNIVDKNESFRS